MTRFRPFRNTDPPALAQLWNRGLPERGVARPLNAHEFDTLVVGKTHFDADGLIIAERDGKAVGFVHAGFGPEDPAGPSQRLDTTMGTVAMLVVEPDLNDPELEAGLIVEAERYLRSRGCLVFYAGGLYPLNPFYWGLYGGGEWSGILNSHGSFVRAVERAGYQPSATTLLFEADLTQGEFRDPKAAFLRRQTRLEVADDALLSRWWDALALDPFHLTTFRLLNRADDRTLARATTWDMAGFSRATGRCQAGLIDVEVDPDHRGHGYGRHIVIEVLRHARAQSVEIVSLQTSASNEPALTLYNAIGFSQVETATLYRLPAELGTRSLDRPSQGESAGVEVF